MDFLITLLILLVLALLMPHIMKQYKENMWKYIKERLELEKEAKELVKLLKGMLCHVNLIPINNIENGKYVNPLDGYLKK